MIIRANRYFWKALLPRLFGKCVNYHSPSGLPANWSRIRVYLGPRTLLAPRFGEYIKRSRYVLGIRLLLRHWWFRQRGIPVRKMEIDQNATDNAINEHVLPYNFGNIDGFFRRRTEQIINVMRSISCVKADESKLLCIGPRNEGEVLLLDAYGFKLENTTSIDLFTYTPTIDLMDMHRMTFDDNAFDIVYSAYVLTYSTDVKKACEEMVRVVKDGGIIAIGYAQQRHGEKNGIMGTLLPEVDEVIGMFEGAVDHVYWRENDWHHRDGTFLNSVIFRVKK